MNIASDDDEGLDAALAGPLLEVPDHFTARVMAALPVRRRRTEVRTQLSPGWRVLQATVLTLCGALGAVEVMLFVCGVWTTTVVGIG